MISAYIYNKPFQDAINTINVGQIEGIPRGVCIETMGVVDGMGIHPLEVSDIPDFMLEMIRPHTVNQNRITEGTIESDKNKRMNELYNGAQCSHMPPCNI